MSILLVRHVEPTSLNFMRRHVTPQINLSLIPDRHPSIVSAYNTSNLWAHPFFAVLKLQTFKETTHVG